jgi:hypothetical protein
LDLIPIWTCCLIITTKRSIGEVVEMVGQGEKRGEEDVEDVRTGKGELGGIRIR